MVHCVNAPCFSCVLRTCLIFMKRDIFISLRCLVSSTGHSWYCAHLFSRLGIAECCKHITDSCTVLWPVELVKFCSGIRLKSPIAARSHVADGGSVLDVGTGSFVISCLDEWIIYLVHKMSMLVELDISATLTASGCSSGGEVAPNCFCCPPSLLLRPPLSRLGLPCPCLSLLLPLPCPFWLLSSSFFGWGLVLSHFWSLPFKLSPPLCCLSVVWWWSSFVFLLLQFHVARAQTAPCRVFLLFLSRVVLSRPSSSLGSLSGWWPFDSMRYSSLMFPSPLRSVLSTLLFSALLCSALLLHSLLSCCKLYTGH